MSKSRECSARYEKEQGKLYDVRTELNKLERRNDSTREQSTLSQFYSERQGYRSDRQVLADVLIKMDGISEEEKRALIVWLPADQKCVVLVIN